jgi:plasmid stabilization system protein ParE
MLAADYTPEARDDLSAIHTSYELCRVGLGDRFLERVHALVETIRQFPGMYAVLDLDVRAAAVKRFPYVVYYKVEPSRILVIAVVHGGRSSSAWRARAGV